jgi:hypothetical protein
MKKLLCVLSVTSLISSAAFADICGIVTREEAQKSLSLLTKGTKISQTYALNPNVTVKTVSVAYSTTMGGVKYYDLKVNGESIDPGHTNVVINKNVSLNLGRIVGCDKEASDPDLVIGTSF